jgi:hypothetical protein
LFDKEKDLVPFLKRNIKDKYHQSEAFECFVVACQSNMPSNVNPERFFTRDKKSILNALDSQGYYQNYNRGFNILVDNIQNNLKLKPAGAKLSQPSLRLDFAGMQQKPITIIPGTYKDKEDQLHPSLQISYRGKSSVPALEKIITEAEKSYLENNVVYKKERGFASNGTQQTRNTYNIRFDTPSQLSSFIETLGNSPSLKVTAKWRDHAMREGHNNGVQRSSP